MTSAGQTLNFSKKNLWIGFIGKTCYTKTIAINRAIIVNKIFFTVEQTNFLNITPHFPPFHQKRRILQQEVSS